MIFAICVDHTDCSMETELAKLLFGSDLGFVSESGVQDTNQDPISKVLVGKSRFLKESIHWETEKI